MSRLSRWSTRVEALATKGDPFSSPGLKWGSLFGRVVVAALLALPLGAAQTTPAVGLGAEGLDLELSLLLVEVGAVTAEVLPVDDVVTVEIGNGHYMFAGLPDAGGTDRITFSVASANDPLRPLYTYVYGAEPGTSVVFRVEGSIPTTGSTVVQDQTFGTVQYQVRSGLPANVGSGTVTFSAANANTGVAVVSSRPAIISNIVEDVATGSWGAMLTYQIEAALTAAPATLSAEFWITMPGGSKLPVPLQTPLRITVRRKL
jgi:hypothetical protein